MGRPGSARPRRRSGLRRSPLPGHEGRGRRRTRFRRCRSRLLDRGTRHLRRCRGLDLTRRDQLVPCCPRRCRVRTCDRRTRRHLQDDRGDHRGSRSRCHRRTRRGIGPGGAIRRLDRGSRRGRGVDVDRRDHLVTRSARPCRLRPLAHDLASERAGRLGALGVDAGHHARRTRAGGGGKHLRGGFANTATDAGAVWTSPDGLRWTLAADQIEAVGIGAVTEGGPGLVAVGATGDPGRMEMDAAVWTSPDGTTWSRVPSLADVLGGPGFQGIGSVAAGGPGLVRDGQRWTLGRRTDGVDLGRRDHMVAGLRPGDPGRKGCDRDGPPPLRVRRFTTRCAPRQTRCAPRQTRCARAGRRV